MPYSPRRLDSSGSDEFSDLSTVINHMLETIEKFHDGLAQSEARFRELAELLPQTIFEMDLQGTLTYVNHAGQEAFGITPEKIQNRVSVREYLIPEDIERMQRGLAHVLSGAKSSGEVYHLKKLDGTLMSAIIYTGPITQVPDSIRVPRQCDRCHRTGEAGRGTQGERGKIPGTHRKYT